MAEIVGLVASITAIAQAAEMATKVSRRLFRLAQRVRAAREEIKDFAMQTQLFAGVVGLAHQSLQQHNRSQGSGSQVLLYVDNFRVIEDVVAASQRVTDHTKQLMPQLRALRSRLSLWTRIKWVMRKSEVEAMGPKMECVKTSLTVIMAVISLEIGQQRERDAPNEAEVARIHEENEYLRGLVQGLVTTLVLQQQRERARRHQEAWSVSTQSLDLPEFEISDALVNLGDSMAETGRVPTTDPDSRSIPVSSTGSRRSRRSRRTPNSSQARQSSHNNPRRRRPLPVTVASQAPAEPASTAREDFLLPRSRRLNISSPAPKPPPPAPSTIAGPSHLPGQDEDTVNRSSYSLRLNPSSGTEIRQVAITTPDGIKTIEALLVPDLEECLIYRGFVVDMGWSFSRLDDDERDAWITYEDGQRERTVGQTVIEWTTTTGPSGARASFEIRCLIFGRVPRRPVERLILGRPYLVERRRVTGDSDTETSAEAGDSL